MEDKHIIVDLDKKDFMKNSKGEVVIYDSEDEACTTCGMYEFENVWVAKLIFNHKENDESISKIAETAGVDMAYVNYCRKHPTESILYKDFVKKYNQ